MNRTISILGLIFFTLCSLNLYSQGDGPGDFTFRRVSFLQNKITTPSAPEAASLGKYGDYQVNTFTGLPGISIPLYSLQGAELSMPFSLTYDGGGIKVEQVPTWVGAGWTLNGGGVISRSVKGDPDMKGNYFSKASTLNQSSSNEYTNKFTENDLLYAAARKEIETQPDVFYLNAVGLNGKFFFKADKSIVMSEIQDVVITPYWNTTTDNIDSFMVKDAVGNTYYFAAAEKTTLTFNQDYGSESRYNYSFVYNSSWYLSRIISPNSTEFIELKYHSETTPYNPNQFVNTNNFRSKTYSQGYQSGGCPDPTCPCGEFPSEYNGGPTATTIENRRFLDEIILKKGTVSIEKLKFYSSTNSYLGGGRKLDKISLSRGSGAATEIIQQIFTYTGGTNRLTLIQLQEKNMNFSAAKEPYQFTYNSNQLPAFSSNDLDHWASSMVQTILPPLEALFR